MIHVRAVSYPPLTAFMPHRAPMLFLDALVEHSASHAVCIRVVREGDLFLDAGGAMSSLVTLELFAQGAAAHFGYQGMIEGGDAVAGALLGTNRIDLAQGSFAVGDTLEVHVRQAMVMPPLAQYECEIKKGGQTLATGSIKVAMGAAESMG